MTQAQIIALRRRPFLVRLRDSYRIYRRLKMSRREALRFAWIVAT
jgi:hypothetical protein